MTHFGDIARLWVELSGIYNAGKVWMGESRVTASWPDMAQQMTALAIVAIVPGVFNTIFVNPFHQPSKESYSE